MTDPVPLRMLDAPVPKPGPICLHRYHEDVEKLEFVLLGALARKERLRSA